MKNKPNSNQEQHLEDKAHEGTPEYGDFGASDEAPNSATNKAKKPITPASTPGADAMTEAEMRASAAKEDPRYAGGDVFDLRNEQTTL